MRQIVAFFVCLSFCVVLFGCGSKYPKDFPKVYPMTVTVTDGSTPIADAQIMFLQTVAGTSGSISVSGMTDSTGKAEIQTAQGAFSAKGIPAGEYVVTVQDYMKLDLGVTPEQAATMSRAEQGEMEKKRQQLIKEFKKKVPENLAKKANKVEDRSPIRFTAAESKNELAIDVSTYK